MLWLARQDDAKVEDAGARVMPAPISRTPLRKLHTRIVLATRDQDWRRAALLLLSAPRQYRAVFSLLVFLKRLGGRASGRDVMGVTQKLPETAPSVEALAARNGMRGEVFTEWPKDHTWPDGAKSTSADAAEMDAWIRNDIERYHRFKARK